MTATGNVACNELPTGGTYLVSVFNAGKAVGSVAGFELKGIRGTPAGKMAAPGSPNATRISAPRLVFQHRGAPRAPAPGNQPLPPLPGGLDPLPPLRSPPPVPLPPP